MGQQTSTSLPSSTGSSAHMPETQESIPATQPPITQPSAAARDPSSPTYIILATQPCTQVENNRPGMTMPEEDNDYERDDGRWDPEEEEDDATSRPATQPETQPCDNYDGVKIEQLSVGNGAEATSDETAGYANPNKSRLDHASNDDDNDDDLVARDGSNAIETSSIVGESLPPSVMLGFRTGGSGRAIDVSDERISKAETILGTTGQRDTGAKVDIDDSLFREDATFRADVNSAAISENANDAQGMRGFAQHSQLTTTMVPPRGMTNTEDDDVDAMEVGQIVNPPLQLVDVGRGDDTTGVNAMEEDNDDSTTITTPHHRPNTVTNPYARSFRMESAKRPVDQISRGSSSSIGFASDTSSANPRDESYKITSYKNSVPDAVPRNQVFNPYYKTNRATKRAVGNSYSKMKAHGTDIVQLPANNGKNSYHEPPSAPAYANGKLPSVRCAGIGISLPMAERLPSRNVSYQPAEVLTVGELYRYLYHTNDHRHAPQQGLKREREELVSVRITGTLLCVATSKPDVMDGVSGTFLLLGDPLENTRLLKKEIQMTQDEDERNAPNITTGDVASATKSTAGLTSILRNKSAPTPRSSADTSKTPGATPATALKCSESTTTVNEKVHASTATASVAKPVDKNNGTTDTIAGKPMSRGILNTNKKKRLVFNGGGSRLSFGGVGSGGGREGGHLGGRKFITPKRISSPMQVSNVNNHLKKRAGLSSVAKRGTLSSISFTNHPNLEQIIQRHPSPIVPVWIGSFYDDDGLDDSVVGDLVMIMGEINTEYCADCHKSNSADGGTDFVVDDDKDLEAPSLDAEKQYTNAEEYLHMHSNESLITTTQLRGVHDATKLIASTALKISGGSKTCGCQRFLKARLIKNANGTDMSLLRESLRARRAYLAERKRQMEYLMPDHMIIEGLYSVGWGPPG